MSYSTTHTSDAVFIIGGRYTQNVVAQYQNDQWHRLPDLKQGRFGHGSIRMGSHTLIVGGYKTNPITELWNFETGTNEIIQPTLPSNRYSFGIALFVVAENYCENRNYNVWIDGIMQP